MTPVNYITTYTGISFDPTDPAPEDISIRDIAHALSMMCRANGHYRLFYSVAQHCICCAEEAALRGYPAEIQLYALLHDASEAYLSDITRPLKLHLENYRGYEQQMMSAIYDAVGIAAPDKAAEKLVKDLDNAALSAEFLKYNGDRILPGASVLHTALPDDEIPHAAAEQRYLELFQSLTAGLSLGQQAGN